MSTVTPGTTPTLPDVLTGLIRGRDLDAATAAWVMDTILAGELTPVQIAGFAVALRTKGETVDELSGLAEAMVGRATPITLPGRTVDIVGSGGDRAGTVNVSTMAGLVMAGAGARVAKHGNRAASSFCGAADVIEALGVPLDVAPERQAAVLDAAGICFLFAAAYHPSLRHASTARRELGVATTFNSLGPLTNPARPAAQAVGVADPRMVDLTAEVLTRRGIDALVFHGTDGLDELTTTSPSTGWLISGGRRTAFTLDPTDLGLPTATPDDLMGGDPAHNARVVHDLLEGATGPVRDIVCLNAAAGLLAHAGPDPDGDVTDQLAHHLGTARAAIDSGAAADTLRTWVRVTAG